MLRILVVDDDDLLRTIISDALTRAGYVVEAVPSATDAMSRYDEFFPDLVLTDYQMPGPSGLDLVDWIAAHRGPVPTIVMSGSGASVERRALAKGAIDYLAKPFAVAFLLRSLNSALAREMSQANDVTEPAIALC